MTLTIEAPVTVPSEKVTPLRLSEAIRLGSLTTRQAFEDYFGIEGESACALGAAAAALGWKWANTSSATLLQRWPDLALGYGCPAGCNELDSLIDTIAALNDDHRWSRERIADWLESIGL